MGFAHASSELQRFDGKAEGQPGLKAYFVELGEKNYKSLALAIKHTPKMIVGSYVVSLIANKAFQSLVGDETYDEMVASDDTYQSSVVANPMHVAIVAPVLEELIFRLSMVPFIKRKDDGFAGKLQNQMMRLYSSYLFAKSHWNNAHPGRIMQTIGAGLTGVMYYNLLEEDIANDGAKTATIYAHMINNGLILLIILSVS